jgi:hypothetical protein
VKAYISDSELFMVSLEDEDTDYVRRVWFFDTLEEAEDYVVWWNSVTEADDDLPSDIAELLEQA